MSEVIASYLVHDASHNLSKKAEGIALGLTVGSWTDLPLLEQEQLKKHKGRVLQVEELEEDEAVNSYLGKKVTRGILTVAYPTVNFSADFPAILTTVFGKLSLDGEIKLLDLQFSEELKEFFPGPAFGIEGIREKVNVYDRPLLMSIFKGVIGRDMDYLLAQLKEQALGGVDLVKDDEILFENPLTPFEKRIITSKELLQSVYEESGHRTLYSVNITGKTTDILDKARRASELGADLLLFNVFAYGIDVLQALREDKDVHLPIMAHPAFSGAMTPSRLYGIENKLLLGKLLRYAGADLVLFPSPYGSVALDRDTTLSIAEELTKEDANFTRSFPVPSAGIHPGLVPLLYHDFELESIVNAGGGVHGHPDGAINGGKAFRQAIDAVLSNQRLTDAAENHESLRKAIELWGSKEVSP